MVAIARNYLNINYVLFMVADVSFHIFFQNNLNFSVLDVIRAVRSYVNENVYAG